MIRLATSLALTGLSLAQDADFMQQIGQQLPGLGTVRATGQTAVDDSGSWVAMTAYEPGCTGCSPVACMRDGVIVAARGMTLSSGYTIPADSTGPIEMDLSASGDLVLGIVLSDGTWVVLWNDHPVLIEGDALPSPEFPAGARLGDVQAIRVADGGRVAILAELFVQGVGFEDFVATMVVNASGVQSWNVIAVEDEVIGQTGLLWNGLAGRRNDTFELGEDGRVVWRPWVNGTTTQGYQPAVAIDDTVPLVPNAPGPIPGTRLELLGTRVGIGGGSWAATVQLERDNGGQGTTQAILVDGAVVIQTGDPCPTLPGAGYTGFSAPLRPMAGGDLMFAGVAGGFKTGLFTLGGHFFENREAVDGLRSHLFISSTESNSSPNGRFATVRSSFGAFEAHFIADRLATPEDPCSVPADSFEPNDSCAASAPVGDGAWIELNVSTANPDWYELTVPATRELSVLANFAQTECDLDVRLWGGDCANPQLLAASESASANERIDWFNVGTGVETVWLEVAVSPTSATTCGRYRLNVRTGTGDGCGSFGGSPDDPLEDGDTPEAALPLGLGSHVGLWTSLWDEDHFRVTVPPGETLEVDVSRGAGSVVPVIAELFAAPDRNVSLDRAWVTHHTRTMSWINTSSAQRDVWLSVEPQPMTGTPFGAASCVTYDLDLRTFFEGLGDRYCPTTPNSTGNAAILYANGSTSVGTGALRLAAFTVPNTTGLFVYGDAMQQVPLANGTLCVAPGARGLFRIAPTSASDGVLATSFLLSAPPHPMGQITPGSTWYFQAWYRDPAAGGAGANLSDALELTFTP